MGQDDESEANSIDDNDERDEDEEPSRDTEEIGAGEGERTEKQCSDTEDDLVDDPQVGPGSGTEAGDDKENELVGDPEEAERESNIASHDEPAGRDRALEAGQRGTQAASVDKPREPIHNLDVNQGGVNEASKNNATSETSSSNAGKNTRSTLPEATSQITIRARDTATAQSVVANPNDNGNAMFLAQPSLDADLQDSDQKSEYFVYCLSLCRSYCIPKHAIVRKSRSAYSCICSVTERMELFGQNAKTLLKSSAIFQGSSFHIDKQLAAMLRKIAEGKSTQLDEGCTYTEVVDHIRRADRASLAARIDKHLSRMRLASMMARDIADHRQKFNAGLSQTDSRAPITFAIADHKYEYQQALHRYNTAAQTGGADDKEAWKDLRWGCRLQEVVSDFGMGILAISPSILRFRDGAIGLRDMGVGPCNQWRATMRADDMFVKFAQMMTLAVKELLQSPEPAETQRPLLIEGPEPAATSTSASDGMPSPPQWAVELLRRFSLKPTAENMRLAAERATPLLPSADQPD